MKTKNHDNITGLEIIALTSKYLRKSNLHIEQIAKGNLSWDDPIVTSVSNNLQQMLDIEKKMMKGLFKIDDLPEWVTAEIIEERKR